MEDTKETQKQEESLGRSEGEFRSKSQKEGETVVTLHSVEILRRSGNLLEEILERSNMQKAWQQVRRNKGAAGVDGKSIEDFAEEMKESWSGIKESLLNGSYKPEPIRKVEIPKANGGKRRLGIPTVQDRLIQQAIAQVLSKYIDTSFEEESYGYRPQKSAAQAVIKAKGYMDAGYETAVELDIESYFDTVNQDRLMSELKKMIKDQRVLDLIRKVLNSGMGKGQGIPQGSPLSPLLSNLYLDPLDKELKKRGHRFVRYADDCKVYVKTVRSGERVLASIQRFLEKKLKLKANRKKSGVSKMCKILGFKIDKKNIRISPEAISRLKDKVRELTIIRGGKSIYKVIEELKPVLRGWNEYYKIQTTRSVYNGLNSWIRRRIRAIIYKSYKNGKTRYKAFKCKFTEHVAYTCAYANYGPWSMARCKPMRILYSTAKLSEMGLRSLSHLR